MSISFSTIPEDNPSSNGLAGFTELSIAISTLISVIEKNSSTMEKTISALCSVIEKNSSTMEKNMVALTSVMEKNCLILQDIKDSQEYSTKFISSHKNTNLSHNSHTLSSVADVLATSASVSSPNFALNNSDSISDAPDTTVVSIPTPSSDSVLTPSSDSAPTPSSYSAPPPSLNLSSFTPVSQITTTHGDLLPMPKPKDGIIPTFDGSNIFQFLREFNYSCSKANIKDEDKYHYFIRYSTPEVCDRVEGFSNLDWPLFHDFLLRFYSAKNTRAIVHSHLFSEVRSFLKEVPKTPIADVLKLIELAFIYAPQKYKDLRISDITITIKHLLDSIPSFRQVIHGDVTSDRALKKYILGNTQTPPLGYSIEDVINFFVNFFTAVTSIEVSKKPSPTNTSFPKAYSVLNPLTP